MPIDDPSHEGGHLDSSADDTKTYVPFDRLQAACQTFSGEWEVGGRPDLPSYLLKVARDDQATLLRNLLEYEVRKRRESGDSPRVEEYLGQLPDHTAIIRQVFLETSRISLTGNEFAATEEFPQHRLPASRLGDFRLVLLNNTKLGMSTPSHCSSRVNWRVAWVTDWLTSRFTRLNLKSARSKERFLRTCRPGWRVIHIDRRRFTEGEQRLSCASHPFLESDGIPVRATYKIEDEREGGSEEIEFQIQWNS